MHAPSDHAIVSTTPTPTEAPVDQNGSKWNANEQIALPSLTPPTPAPWRPAIPALTQKQLTAISLLCAGTSIDLTAARLRVGRTTLYRWRTTHPAFRAELARRQRELRDTASRRFRLTLLRALATVADQIDTARHQEDRVKTALALLRHADLKTLLTSDDQEPLTAAQSLDHLIRADWAAANAHPDRQVDHYERQQYLQQLAHDESHPDPATHSAPTHRRLAGTRNAPPEIYPTPENAPAQSQTPEFPEDSAASPSRE